MHYTCVYIYIYTHICIHQFVLFSLVQTEAQTRPTQLTSELLAKCVILY